MVYLILAWRRRVRALGSLILLRLVFLHVQNGHIVIRAKRLVKIVKELTLQFWLLLLFLYNLSFLSLDSLRSRFLLALLSFLLLLLLLILLLLKLLLLLLLFLSGLGFTLLF